MNKEGNRLWAIGYRQINAIAYSLLPIACCIFLFGCSSAPPSRLDAEIISIELNGKADSAFRSGNFKRALELYGEALKASSSIEHADGIAINLMNMAVVYRKLDDRENARKCLDEILNFRHVPFYPSQLAGAAFIKAVLYVDEGKYPSAIEWADKALNFCKDETCAEKGKIYNLKAKIALLNNTPDAALAFGAEGLQWNRSLGERQEEANSFRLLADAKVAAKAYEEARGFYQDALVLDKDAGFAMKMAMDLMGIGNVLCMQGRQEDAMEFFKRAQFISKSSGDNKGTARAEEMIGGCSSSK